MAATRLLLSRSSGRLPTAAAAPTLLRWRPAGARLMAFGQQQQRWLSSASKPESEVKADVEEDAPEFVESEPVFDEKEFEVDETPTYAAREPENVPIRERVVGEAKRHTFKAETKKILDIMAKSVYTDREVFVRELISNASDALEKARYLQSSGQIPATDKPLEIRIYTDSKTNRLIIQDSGVGMTAQEMINNLGTIAHSGSKAFMSQMQDGGDAIIGQFGVGFYSSFMVSDKVEVYSKSAVADEPAHQWISDGSGEFDLAEAEDVERGTKIIINLKEEASEYATTHGVETVIKKYSNFVSFPVFLNDRKISNVGAIWARDKDSITEEEHTAFYRYVADAYDTPMYRLHYKADVPLSITALFYFPERHLEKMGMGRLDPGVSLYCRKVLIQGKCKTILPDWLRFVQGVVDSEDIPLNLSRESMQNSNLISRMNTILSKRIIKFLTTEAKRDERKYLKFWNEFGVFLKEGICRDFNNKDALAELVRYETSHSDVAVSLDEYIGRMPPEQKGIYYLTAPNRSSALNSPYYETFKSKGIEVLFLYQDIDEFVVTNIRTYQTRKLTSITSKDLNLDGLKGSTLEEDLPTHSELEKFPELSEDESKELCDFMVQSLPDKLSDVSVTDRLVNSPAIIVDHESAAVRRMIKMVDHNLGMNSDLPKQKMHINPKHKIMRKLFKLKDGDPALSQVVVAQIFDNALIAADIMDNPRTMLDRLHTIIDYAVSKQ